MSGVPFLLLRLAGEVSCPNYAARKFGVAAGMFMAHAKSLCPDLVVVPYEFERYQAVSEQVGQGTT